MPADNIYVQITASSESTNRTRTVIVRVPRACIDKVRQEKNDFHSDDNTIAKSLAEPLAIYAFTHRTIFSKYELAYSFAPTAPSEIDGRSPNLSQAGLKTWVIS
jgi:hypothetical protein